MSWQSSLVPGLWHLTCCHHKSHGHGIRRRPVQSGQSKRAGTMAWRSCVLTAFCNGMGSLFVVHDHQGNITTHHWIPDPRIFLYLCTFKTTCFSPNLTRRHCNWRSSGYLERYFLLMFWKKNIDTKHNCQAWGIGYCSPVIWFSFHSFTK